MPQQMPVSGGRTLNTVRWWHAAAWGAGLGGGAGALAAWAIGTALLPLEAEDIAGTVLFGASLGTLAVTIGQVAGRWVRRRRSRLLLGAVVALPGLWVSADLLYAILVCRSHDRWEAATERGSDGVRRGCEAFTAGRGDTAFLLIHGLADSPAVYRRMAAALADRGFTCQAMRLPYFAMPLAEYSRSTAAYWTRALDASLEAL
jgi:hypothetical protein